MFFPLRPSPHICKIFTPFGEAVLLSIRQEDHIYVAKLFSNGAMLYLHKDRVIFHNRCHPMGIGTEIHTLYGTGLVVHQRPTDFVFEIYPSVINFCIFPLLVTTRNKQLKFKRHIYSIYFHLIITA